MLNGRAGCGGMPHAAIRSDKGMQPLGAGRVLLRLDAGGLFYYVDIKNVAIQPVRPPHGNREGPGFMEQDYGEGPWKPGWSAIYL